MTHASNSSTAAPVASLAGRGRSMPGTARTRGWARLGLRRPEVLGPHAPTARRRCCGKAKGVAKEGRGGAAPGGHSALAAGLRSRWDGAQRPERVLARRRPVPALLDKGGRAPDEQRSKRERPRERVNRARAAARRPQEGSGQGQQCDAMLRATRP
jgi:hypothetical protein